MSGVLALLRRSSPLRRPSVDMRVESSAARPMSPERRDALAMVGRALIVRARPGAHLPTISIF